MECQEIFNKIDALKDQYTQIWEDICNIESPTSCKEGVDAVGRYIMALAEKKGWQISVSHQDVSGDAICITMNGDSKLEPVSISGHIDTVHPIGFFGTPAVHKDDEKMYGPGVHDCKGGVVVGLLAMDALQSCGYNKRPVKMLLQSDEETSSKGSNKATINWIAQQAADSVGFFNLEGGTIDRTTICRKGIARYKFTVTGKQAHSGRCSEGASAIAQAAHMILELEKFKDQESLTCNCGTIEGGSTPNTVPGKCVFVADFRCATPEDEEIAAAAAKKVCQTEYVPGCTSSYELLSSRVSMPIRQRNLDLLEKVNSILAMEGLKTMEGKSLPGGSDASDVSATGVPCLDSLGIQGGRSHSEDEFAILASLSPSAKRLAAILYHI